MEPERKAALIARLAEVIETEGPGEGTAPAGTTQPHRIVAEGAQQVKQIMEKTMDQANRAAETMFKAAEEMAEFGRGNVEAMTRATQTYVAGVQDLGRHAMAMMQGLTDHALEGAKALTTVKSLQEAAQVQANYSRTAMEKAITETVKLQEAALKVAEQSFAPLSARMTVAVERFSRPIAA